MSFFFTLIKVSLCYDERLVVPFQVGSNGRKNENSKSKYCKCFALQ